MKRKIVSVTRIANQLTNPTPEFVSLVGHGANQTPFRTVKSEDIADFRGMDIKEDEMSKKTKQSTTKKQTTDFPKAAEVQKVAFTGDKFPDAETVSSYLEGKGYTDFEVTKSDEGFSVVAKSEDAFTEVKTIEVEDGVVFHVGKLAEGQDGLESDKPLEKTQELLFKTQKGETSAEVVKKYYDCCCGTWEPPAGKTMADVLTEQFADGTFPAMYQLSDAFYNAIRNLVKAGEIAQIKTLTTEYGDMIVSILTALSTAGVDTAQKQFLAEPEESAMKKDQVTKTEEEVETVTVETEADTGKATTETTTDAAEQPADDKVEKSDKTDMAELIAKAVTSAIAPLQKNMETLQGELASLSKGTSGSLAELGEKISKTGERVDELQSIRQTRKSADDESLGGSTETVEDSERARRAAHDERILRSSLGFLNPKK